VRSNAPAGMHRPSNAASFHHGLSAKLRPQNAERKAEEVRVEKTVVAVGCPWHVSAFPAFVPE